MSPNIDENFGRLRSRLQSLGLEENTILIFMTDNGTACGAKVDKEGFVVDGYNASMRGVKNWQYDGGHRTPFFLRWAAGGLDKGKDVNNLTANIDFMPTILELCGIDAADRDFHGKSLKPLLYGAQWQQRAIVTDSQRLTTPLKWRLSCVMTDKYRLINGLELYDITQDPQQKNDISAAMPDTVARLRQEYENWWRLVSQKDEQEIPITISKYKTTNLCCHDWRSDTADGNLAMQHLQDRDFDDCFCPWSQGHIREALIANGYWEIDVIDSGSYIIELCRWPKESKHKLKEGFTGDDVQWCREQILEQSHWLYENGKALDIVEARLKVNETEYIATPKSEQTGVQFEVFMPKAATHLKTLFKLSDGTTLGAYYVYISPK